MEVWLNRRKGVAYAADTDAAKEELRKKLEGVDGFERVTSWPGIVQFKATGTKILDVTTLDTPGYI